MQTDSLPAELPGKLKNTGVGSQSLLQGIFLTQESNEGLLHCRQILYQLNYQGSCYSYPAAAAAAKSLQSCPTLCNPWNSPGQNTGVGSCSLLQGIFPTQGLNPGLPHCRQILYQLSHKGSPTVVHIPLGSQMYITRNGFLEK